MIEKTNIRKEFKEEEKTVLEVSELLLILEEKINEVVEAVNNMEEKSIYYSD